MRLLAVTLTLLGTTTSAEVLLYKPTGPYYVTQSQHVLNHTTPDDFTAPDGSGGVGKTMLVTTYGPTLSAPQRTRPWVDATNAAIWGAALGIPASLLSSLVTELQRQAPPPPGLSSYTTTTATTTNPGDDACPVPPHPLLTTTTTTPKRRRPPSILFLPGAGMPCFAYTAYLSELASWGYTVFAIDHPGEPPYLEFPDGSGVRSAFPPLANWTVPQLQQIYAHRVADAAALLRRPEGSLRSLIQQQSQSESEQQCYCYLGGGDDDSVDLSAFFVFGHSIGGAAAAGIMAQQKSSTSTTSSSLPPLLAGCNIDGWFFFDIWDLYGNGTGPAAPYPDLAPRPFLEIAKQTGPPDAAPDATWANFSAAQSGWLRDVGVAGAEHFDFSDLPLLVDALGLRDGMMPSSGGSGLLGGIAGVRMVEVVMGLVRAVVGYVEGRNGLEEVDRVQQGFPETWVREAKDGAVGRGG